MKNSAASFGSTGVPFRISVTYRPIQELKPDPPTHGATARGRSGRSPTASGPSDSMSRS